VSVEGYNPKDIDAKDLNIPTNQEEYPPNSINTDQKDFGAGRYVIPVFHLEPFIQKNIRKIPFVAARLHLDNILLHHETTEKAKETNQSIKGSWNTDLANIVVEGNTSEERARYIIDRVNNIEESRLKEGKKGIAVVIIARYKLEDDETIMQVKQDLKDRTGLEVATFSTRQYRSHYHTFEYPIFEKLNTNK